MLMNNTGLYQNKNMKIFKFLVVSEGFTDYQEQIVVVHGAESFIDAFKKALDLPDNKNVRSIKLLDYYAI